MAAFHLKKDDLLPYIEKTLYGADEEPLDLTGATVTWSMRPSSSNTPKVDAEACVIVGDAANGRVQYQWASGDTDTAGTFFGEFVATIGGKPLTVPNKGTVTVEISARLS